MHIGLWGAAYGELPDSGTVLRIMLYIPTPKNPVLVEQARNTEITFKSVIIVNHFNWVWSLPGWALPTHLCVYNIHKTAQLPFLCSHMLYVRKRKDG